jgi:hypothetical protein
MIEAHAYGYWLQIGASILPTTGTGARPVPAFEQRLILFAGFGQAFFHGPCGDLYARSEAQLGENVGDVPFDLAFGDHQGGSSARSSSSM